MTPPNFDNLSTFQLASAANKKLTKLCQKNTPDGRLYFVTLEGEEMRATKARQLLIDYITAKQRAVGLCA